MNATGTQPRRALAWSITTVVVLLCVAALAANAAPAAASGELLAADKAFCDATRARGLDGWVDAFADNAALPQFDPPLVGKDAIRRAYAGMFSLKDLDFRWQPDSAGLLPQGEIGYTTGHFTRSWTDDSGVRQTRGGNYLTVWAKQKDGTWKVVGDYGTNNPAAKK